ncbi:MAG: hypothetical protein K0R43_51 [Pseudoduganella sp.]|jgi:hypothetical protein|nr:hypothetical protein [Pseudoduganella sp.]
MALQLKKSMVRDSAINSALCVVAAVAIAQMADLHEELFWLVLLAGVVALLTFLRSAHRIRQRTLAPLLEPASYVRIARDSPLVRDQVDWSVIDDYTAQLATRGFHPVGDYTAYPMPGALVGVAAMFTNAEASVMIEIQQLKLLPSAGPERMRDGIYFSITSLVGGQIRVITCSHKPQAATYLVRGDHDVLNADPHKGLLALLAQHGDLLLRLRQRIGKSAVPGLTVERYVLAIREAQAQARQRLSAMSGYAIAGVVDQFEAKAKLRWAPSSSALKSVPWRALEELDSAYAVEGQPPVFQASLSW